MLDMKDTIQSYEDSCEQVRGRITQLHEQIGEAHRSGEQQRMQTLNERRYLLYRELWDMEKAIREMREYVYGKPCGKRPARAG